MIDFKYSDTAGWFGIYFALIATILSIVFFFIAGLGGMRIGFKKFAPGWYPWIFILIPVGMTIGALVAIPAFWTVYEFRSLDLEKVGSIRVRETNEPDGKVVRYSNRVETKNVLQLMRWCRHVEHQHDELYDGYVLEILMDDSTSSGLALRVYRKSSVEGSRKAVIAQYSGFEAGEYDCPEIQEWVAKNIDPLFGRTPTPQTQLPNPPYTSPATRPVQTSTR